GCPPGIPLVDQVNTWKVPYVAPSLGLVLWIGAGYTWWLALSTHRQYKDSTYYARSWPCVLAPVVAFCAIVIQYFLYGLKPEAWFWWLTIFVGAVRIGLVSRARWLAAQEISDRDKKKMDAVEAAITARAAAAACAAAARAAASAARAAAAAPAAASAA